MNGASDRPLLSVMIPTFNCAELLRQTLESVLAQDLGPQRMHIEVVDDCSTRDDPEAVVREIGRGRVVFSRNAQNQGLVGNFNQCIARSRGELLQILHGDDYILPGFYAEILRLAASAPDAALYGCRNFGVDESNLIAWVSERLRALETRAHCAEPFYYGTTLQFCGVVLRRSFLEAHGGFRSDLRWTTDCEMWARASAIGGAIVSPQVLACYRQCSGNDTSLLMKKGDNVRDLMLLNQIFAQRYPDFSLVRGQRRAAEIALYQAEKFAALDETDAASVNWELWRQLTPTKSRWMRALRGVKGRLAAGLRILS